MTCILHVWLTNHNHHRKPVASSGQLTLLPGDEAVWNLGITKVREGMSPFSAQASQPGRLSPADKGAPKYCRECSGATGRTAVPSATAYNCMHAPPVVQMLQAHVVSGCAVRPGPKPGGQGPAAAPLDPAPTPPPTGLTQRLRNRRCRCRCRCRQRRCFGSCCACPGQGCRKPAAAARPRASCQHLPARAVRQPAKPPPAAASAQPKPASAQRNSLPAGRVLSLHAAGAALRLARPQGCGAAVLQQPGTAGRRQLGPLQPAAALQLRAAAKRSTAEPEEG